MSKKTTSIMAVIVLLLMILAGTFAWTQYNQHKTNEANGPGLRYDVSLIEDFEEIENWKVSDAAYKKQIRVKNSGLTDGSYGDVYVRLQLKEYLEMAKLVYTYTDYRLMIGTDGKFIKADTVADLNDKLTDLGYESGSHEPVYRKGIEDDREYYYAKTKAGDDNGQYGKFLLLSASSGEAVSIDGKKRATDTDAHDLATNGECNYTIHGWKATPGEPEDCELGFHDYISWYLGEDVISLEEWLDTDGPYEGLPTEKWIYDTRSTNIEGWVYWGAALKPQETTSNLLEAVKLIKQPDDNFYYALHVDMEAVSLGEITTAQELKWTDAPEEILTSYTIPIVTGIAWSSDTVMPAQLTRGTAIAMADLLDITILNGSLADVELEWFFTPVYSVAGRSLGPGELTTTDDGSHISTEGVLTIAAGETALSLTVTARSKMNADKSVSIPIPIGGPMVTGVTVPAVAGVVTAGTNYTMGIATVQGSGSPSQEVTWSVSGNSSNNTTIGTDRVLHVALDETAASIIVTATSTFDTKKACPVAVNIANVTGVSVTTGNVTAYKGYTQTFAASVAGNNSPEQSVTWSVEGAGTASPDTRFNGATLKVGSDETRTTLTVKATSTIDTSQIGTATVTVEELTDSNPKVMDIKVTGATVNAGGSTTLPAPTVTVVNGALQTVTWSVSGKTSGSTTIDPNTGYLEVAMDETASTFQVIATSTVDTGKSGSATITVRKVTGVSITTGVTSVLKGYTQTFAASVAGLNSPAQTVKWSVEGAKSTDTYMSGVILKVGFDETAATLTVRATSTLDTNKSGTATISVAEAGDTPQVTAIKFTDYGTVTVNTGGNTTIDIPAVIVVNDAPQEVIWSLAGNTSSATKIDQTTRRVDVGMDEKAEALQVIATSTYDNTKSGSTTINVRRATTVTVTPDDTTVYNGYTKTFAASVAGINSPAQTVTWIVTGGGTGTFISGGTLTVAAGETATRLTVRATSTVTNTVYGEATVRVEEVGASAVTNIAVTGTTTLNTGATNITFAAEVTTVGDATDSVTWSVSGSTSAATTIASGGVLKVGMDEEASTFQVIATSDEDPTKFGSATITVVRVTSITLNTDHAVVPKGEYQAFNAVVAGVNNPAWNGVTWTITSPKSSGTAISGLGGLTVSVNETNPTLTLKATSNVTTTVYGEVTVTVSDTGYPTWADSSTTITGVASDVGKKFTADGYTWRILAVDRDGNMLVTPTVLLTRTITTDAAYPGALASNNTQFRPDTTRNDYEGSTLASVMTTFYNNGITTLHDYVQPVNIKTESMAEFSQTAVRESGLSVVDETGVPTAFALSTSEVNKYFISTADRMATTNNFWLRSPYWLAAYSGLVRVAGDITVDTVTNAQGVRPALWLTRVPTP